MYTPARWNIRPRGASIFTGAKPGSSGTVSKRLPRYEVLSPSASTTKSPSCAERKSPARKLLCAVKCVIDSKWSDADGRAQVRFRSGGASVDDEGDPEEQTAMNEGATTSPPIWPSPAEETQGARLRLGSGRLCFMTQAVSSGGPNRYQTTRSIRCGD
jgi:hypothetical protein